ncbi:hypothetical protein [Brachybacterium sp. AOP29-B2-41]|uniref:hypothetical protein n=1 Tax=Brachybacterium sp. AOP29-B2-41 TaxID=3457704 RepID=UPI004034022C
MSGFYGADTSQLRDHSALLRDRATAIGDLRARLEPAVMDESIWQGPDADSFRAEWSSRTVALFEEVTSRITHHGSELERHAEEQDEASDGESGSGQGSGGGQGSDESEGSWLDRLLGGVNDGIGVFNKLQKAFSSGKKVWDIMRVIDRSTDFIKGAEDIFQLAAGTWKYGKDITDSVYGVGSEFSGLAKKLIGQLPFNVPTGLGNKNLFGWVDDAAGKLSKVAPFLDDVAPYLGKALPALDVFTGGLQMIQGIKSGDTFSAITGGASAVGGGLMLAGGALSATGVGAVIGGPLVAAGAIISGGAALADVGKMVYDNWDTISSTATDAWNSTTDFVGDTAGAVSEGVGNVVDSVSDGVSNAVDGLADALPW